MSWKDDINHVLKHKFKENKKTIMVDEGVRLKVKFEGYNYYWKGYDSGKQEDAPGIFIEFNCYIIRYVNTKLDINIGINDPKPYITQYREITSEPEGYALLIWKQWVDAIINQPAYYLQKFDYKEVIKKLL